MAETSTYQPGLAPKHLSEEIVVVPKNIFDQLGVGQGFSGQQSLMLLQQAISENMFYVRRDIAEQDERYKQIIPYFIFKFQDKLFVMQRRATASEQRLRNKVSLGIGGHLRKSDLSGSIEQWGLREFNEEIAYGGGLDISFLGVINDDSNAVGRVHIGLVFILQGDSDQIRVRSELKKGGLMTAAQAEEYFEQMESWSQLVFTHLRNHGI